MRNKGSTLIEILVALFIFTILSTILVAALHHVIGAQSGAEDKADRLRKLQVALLLLSREVEQAVNRPIINEAGKQTAAFTGHPQGFILTHMGSALSRTGYRFDQGKLLRISWPALDLAPRTTPHARVLLRKVDEVRFYYLDNNKQFQKSWPIQSEQNQPLPQAVKVVLIFSGWGRIEQLYPLLFKVHNANAKAAEPKKS